MRQSATLSFVTDRRGFIVAALGGFAAALGLAKVAPRRRHEIQIGTWAGDQWIGTQSIQCSFCQRGEPCPNDAASRWASGAALLKRGDVFTVAMP